MKQNSEHPNDKKYLISPDSVFELIETYPVIKYVLYAIGGVFIIWTMGKFSMMLADATLNFKAFQYALKS